MASRLEASCAMRLSRIMTWPAKKRGKENTWRHTKSQVDRFRWKKLAMTRVEKNTTSCRNAIFRIALRTRTRAVETNIVGGAETMVAVVVVVVVVVDDKEDVFGWNVAP